MPQLTDEAAQSARDSAIQYIKHLTDRHQLLVAQAKDVKKEIDDFRASLDFRVSPGKGRKSKKAKNVETPETNVFNPEETESQPSFDSVAAE